MPVPTVGTVIPPAPPPDDTDHPAVLDVGTVDDTDPVDLVETDDPGIEPPPEWGNR